MRWFFPIESACYVRLQNVTLCCGRSQSASIISKMDRIVMANDDEKMVYAEFPLECIVCTWIGQIGESVTKVVWYRTISERERKNNWKSEASYVLLFEVKRNTSHFSVSDWRKVGTVWGEYRISVNCSTTTYIWVIKENEVSSMYIRWLVAVYTTSRHSNFPFSFFPRNFLKFSRRVSWGIPTRLRTSTNRIRRNTVVKSVVQLIFFVFIEFPVVYPIHHPPFAVWNFFFSPGIDTIFVENFQRRITRVIAETSYMWKRRYILIGRRKFCDDLKT